MAVPGSTAPLPPSTANWHWRSKDVTPWAKSWFETQVCGSVVFTEGLSSVKIDSLKSFTGDAEVGMRKSKLLTIYDVHLEYSWSGTDSEGNVVEGNLKLPEVCHDVGVDGDGDYEFTVGTTSSSTSGSRATVTILKARLPAFLKAKLQPFPEAMLETHARDVKVEGTPAASGTSTPVPEAGDAAKLQPLKALQSTKATNTSTVKVEATFAASAGDLYELLTDESKISMWSRAAAQSKPEPDAEYSIFGGNITGKYVTLDKPTKIVQTWALKSPNWPSNHSATMTTTLDQGSDSTQVKFQLSGVPKGQEDEIRNNLNGYYIRGFQSIGYVMLVHETPSRSIVSPSKPPVVSQPSSYSWIVATSLAVSVLCVVIGVRYIHS